MPGAVVDFLTEELRRTDCFLEFGAGGSTVLAARLGVRQIISIESDPDFLEQIAAKVESLRTNSELHALHADIGKTGAWGRPQDTSQFISWHSYAQVGFLRAEKLGVSPDFILIDGRFRVACFLASLLCANPGTRVLFDDYLGRSKYARGTERFVEPDFRLDRAAVFTVPQRIDARRVAFALARYSVRPSS